MNKSQRLGRFIVMFTAGWSIALSFFIILAFFITQGFTLQIVIPRLIRFSLTILLFVLIYRGNAIARFITVILCILGAIAATNHPWLMLSFLTIAVLLGLPYVARFQDYQKIKLL